MGQTPAVSRVGRVESSLLNATKWILGVASKHVFELRCSVAAPPPHMHTGHGHRDVWPRLRFCFDLQPPSQTGPIPSAHHFVLLACPDPAPSLAPLKLAGGCRDVGMLGLARLLRWSPQKSTQPTLGDMFWQQRSPAIGPGARRPRRTNSRSPDARRRQEGVGQRCPSSREMPIAATSTVFKGHWVVLQREGGERNGADPNSRLLFGGRGTALAPLLPPCGHSGAAPAVVWTGHSHRPQHTDIITSALRLCSPIVSNGSRALVQNSRSQESGEPSTQPYSGSSRRRLQGSRRRLGSDRRRLEGNRRRLEVAAERWFGLGTP